MQTNTETLDLSALLFSPRGRITRKTFFYNTVLINIVCWALYGAAVFAYPISQPVAGLFNGILTFLIPISLYSYSVQLIKRMHDINKSAFLATPALVYLGIIYFFGKDPIEPMNRLLPFGFNILLVCLSTLGGLTVMLIGISVKGQSGPNKYGSDPLQRDPKPN